MEKLMPIINDLLIVVANLIIFTQMISWKNPILRNKIIIYTGCVVIVAAYFVAAYYLNVPASISAALCMTLPSLILFWIFSECKDSRFFLTFCFVDTVSLIIGFLSRYVGVLTGTVGVYLAPFVSFLLYAAIIFFGRNYFKKYTELLRVEKAGWTGMMLSSFLIYIVLIFTAAYPKPLIERIEYAPAYALFGLVVLVSYAVFIQSIVKTKKIYEQYEQLQREKAFHKIAYTDPLTGLFNRACYIERINELERALENHESICCVVLDINDFKSVNDRFGHHAGDEILKGVADVMRTVFVEEERYLFRMGGDEFFVVFIDRSETYVHEKLEQLKKRLSERQQYVPALITVAAGYAYLEGQALKETTLEKAFISADKNMYENKETIKLSAKN